MRVEIANNIKSTLHGIENQNAKDFLKLVEEKFRSADKALARTLMAELTTMKLDGLKSMQQHVLDTTNTAARLKTLGMNMDGSFLVKLLQEEARLKKQRVHSVNLERGHFQKDCPKRKAWIEKKGIHYVFVCFESNLYEVLSNTWWFDYGVTTHAFNITSQLVSNLRTAWMGGFYLFADVAKYDRTYNRPVERSGEANPVASKTHMSSEGFDDVGLRYVGGRWVWLEFDSMDQVERVKTSKALKEIFLEFKDVSHDFIPDERCVWIDLVGLPLASWAPEVYKKLGGRWGSSVFTDMVSDGPMSHGKVCVLTESLHRVIESFIVSYRNRTYRIIATEFAYWAPNIESMEVNSESNPLERKDAEGLSLDESLENEEHLDVDKEDVRGVESDLVDSFEEGEIRDDSVLYNDGCIKDCMEKNLEDDAGEILGVHF
ncbi:hypothetical protein Tco_0867059 [Tanacetum coccineum]